VRSSKVTIKFLTRFTLVCYCVLFKQKLVIRYGPGVSSLASQGGTLPQLRIANVPPQPVFPQTIWGWSDPHPAPEVRRWLYRSLFLASTVSALHWNAHIWNSSHPLLVTYYCWVTVYSPSMEVKKKNADRCQTLGIEHGSVKSTDQVSAKCAIRLVISNGSYWTWEQCQFIETFFYMLQ